MTKPEAKWKTYTVRVTTYQDIDVTLPEQQFKDRVWRKAVGKANFQGHLQDVEVVTERPAAPEEIAEEGWEA